MKAIKRVRGRKNQQVRARHYRKNPLCVRCLAKDPPIVRMWTQLDHVIALMNGGTNDDSNRQGLCDECHAAKTCEDIGVKHKPNVRIGLDGFPITSPKG